MPAWGVTPAGFAVKPLANILADMQTQVLQTINPQFDLSPGTPDGQMLGIYANESAALWELLQICYNQFNRSDVEGQGADNIGDLTGTPREGASFTQVFCTANLNVANAPYAAGSLVASVVGNPSLTFSNLQAVTAGQISGGVATGILFQAQTIGPTPTINPGTLTVIATPVTGWTAITNPAAQSQAGTNAELDPAYVLRQAQDLAVEGTCNPSATAAAIVQLGAAQSPPQTLSVTVVQNQTQFTQVVSGIALPPHTYCVVVYDGGTGWALGAGQQLIANTIYANEPSGITTVGTTVVTVNDPVLGNQVVAYTVPTTVPIFVTATVAPRAGFAFPALVSAIQSALVAAAVAPTPPNGVPPNGQMTPGQPIVGSQLEAVIASVPGVLDVQALTFGTTANPTNTAPIVLTSAQVGTISPATVATNVVINLGVAP